MPGEFFFMGIGALGVSLAGFAGIIATLDRRPSSAVREWRIRYIVFGGFILVFAGFLTVVTHSVTGENMVRTVRFVSAVVAVTLSVHYRIAQRPGPAWPNHLGRRMAVFFSWFGISLWVLNVFLGRLPLLQALFLQLLFDPASVFVNAVRDISRGDPVGQSDQQKGGAGYESGDVG